MKIKFYSQTYEFIRSVSFSHISNQKFEQILNKNNVIIINDNCSDYDYFISHTYKYNNNILFFEENNLNKKIIFNGREDASNVYVNLIANHPNVIAYLKDYTNKFLLYTCLNMIQFYYCFNDKTINMENTNITNYTLNKIKNCHWNINQYSCCGKQFEYRTMTQPLIKTLDVVSIFHMRENQLDGQHRKILYDTLILLKNKYNIFVDQDVEPSLFFEKFSQAKIAVCPYGMGERTASDYNAIYNECILIKPYSSYVDCDCNFHNNANFYVNCRVDYSDLDYTIEKILNNYEYYYNNMLKAKQHLLSITPEYHIDNFFNLISNCEKLTLDYLNSSFPNVIDENETMRFIAYTKISNVLFNLNDLEYIFYNDDHISNKMLDILNTKNNNYIICIPNIYGNIDKLYLDLIENKNQKEFYSKYQIKYVNKKNLFINFDKITYFSSFISYPHYFVDTFNENFYTTIQEMFINRKSLIVTTYENFLKNQLLIKYNENINGFILNKDFVNEIDEINNKIKKKISIEKFDTCFVMVEKFSSLISSELSNYVKVIDLGKLFGTYGFFLKYIQTQI